MLTALQQDLVMSVNVKGLPPARAIVYYALHSTIVTSIIISGMQLAKLLGGTVIVETIFTLPGTGRPMLTAIEQQGIILLQGIVLFITSMVASVSLVTDLTVMAANPTVRAGEEAVQGWRKNRTYLSRQVLSRQPASQLYVSFRFPGCLQIRKKWIH